MLNHGQYDREDKQRILGLEDAVVPILIKYSVKDDGLEKLESQRHHLDECLSGFNNIMDNRSLHGIMDSEHVAGVDPKAVTKLPVGRMLQGAALQGHSPLRHQATDHFSAERRPPFAVRPGRERARGRYVQRQVQLCIPFARRRMGTLQVAPEGALGGW